MNKAAGAGELITGGKGKREITQVADDQNWRSYVANELKGAETWNQDWGFLVAKGMHLPYTLNIKQFKMLMI